jgi:hypothetical protein
MTYSVSYKKKNGIFWKTLKHVKGDGIIELPSGEDGERLVFPIRYFIMEDESRVEIPMDHYVFRFSKERFISIHRSMEQEAGQPIPIRGREK